MVLTHFLPMPPLDLRRTVGHETTEHFENPTGALAFVERVPAENYRSVLDFGCGCGRVARRMLLQKEYIPQRFLGVDLYRPSIEWCKSNLVYPGWEFRHLDIYNTGLNPQGKQLVDLDLAETFALVNAHSVFTHIIERDLEFYFAQCARALSDDGILRSTWFLFDKTGFPMMQEYQNCLYINPEDPTNAAIYDSDFVRNLHSRHGLVIFAAYPPGIRGHQWELFARRGAPPHTSFEADTAPAGLARPPTGHSYENGG